MFFTNSTNCFDIRNNPLIRRICNPNHRNITTSTARLFEQKLNLEIYSLDAEEPQQDDPGNLIIPFMDYKVSNDFGEIYFHDYERIKLPTYLFSNIASSSDLIAFKIMDMEMFPQYSIGDVVIINRLKRNIDDDHQYLIRVNGKFYIRTLRTLNKKLEVCALNKIQEYDINDKNIKIFGIVDTEIRKKLYTG